LEFRIKGLVFRVKDSGLKGFAFHGLIFIFEVIYCNVGNESNDLTSIVDTSSGRTR
jgi:hypothetical protein